MRTRVGGIQPTAAQGRNKDVGMKHERQNGKPTMCIAVYMGKRPGDLSPRG